MEKLKIILFICNWGPHAAFQALQDSGADIPPEVSMIRIPCTGSMSKSLLFRAFELGADGVALVGCEPGSCRYGSGTDVAERNVEDTRGILDLLGLGGDRLRPAMFLPEESDALLTFLQGLSSGHSNHGKEPGDADPAGSAGAHRKGSGSPDHGQPRHLRLPGLREMFFGMSRCAFGQVLFPESHGKRHYSRKLRIARCGQRCMVLSDLRTLP